MTERRRLRARMISEGTYEDATLLEHEQPLHALAVWVAMIVTADTAGRTEGNPIILCEGILSGLREKVPSLGVELVASLLDEFEAAGKIQRYKHAGRIHAQLCNYENHQHFTHPIVSERPAPPDIEPPTKTLARLVHERFATDTRYSYHTLAQRLLKEGMKDLPQIIAVLDFLSRTPGVKNPWAFIHSEGIQNTGLLIATDEHVAQERASRRPSNPRSLGTIITQAMEQAKQEKPICAPQNLTGSS